MQPTFELTLHPVDLRTFGLNPYGDPLYRVVWADTRKSKVVCRGKVHVLPRYAHGDEASLAGHWVLEKWAPPETVVGMTREQYEAMLAAMPGAAAEEYPSRGDYEFSYAFEGSVDEVFLHKQLAMHEFNHRKLTAKDRENAMAADEEKKEAVAEEKFEQLFEEAREEISCLN